MSKFKDTGKFKHIRSLDDLTVYMTIGGVPERKKCECDELKGFFCKLHNLEMHGGPAGDVES